MSGDPIDVIMQEVEEALEHESSLEEDDLSYESVDSPPPLKRMKLSYSPGQLVPFGSKRGGCTLRESRTEPVLNPSFGPLRPPDKNVFVGEC